MWKLAIIAMFAACTTPVTGDNEEQLLGCPAAKWPLDLPLDDITPGCQAVTNIELLVIDPCANPTLDGLPDWSCKAFPDKPLVHCERRFTEDFAIYLDITPYRVEYLVGACRYEFQ